MWKPLALSSTLLALAMLGCKWSRPQPEEMAVVTAPPAPLPSPSPAQPPAAPDTHPARTEALSAKDTIRTVPRAPAPRKSSQVKPKKTSTVPQASRLAAPEAIRLDWEPRTLEEAMSYSKDLWAAAKRLSASQYDSSVLYTQKALRTFENGSLFYLKGTLLLQKGDPAGALTAAERSIAISDHWDPEDLIRAYGVRADALAELYARFPSEITRLKAAAAKTQSRIYSHATPN
jgi:hypothetical protein